MQKTKILMLHGLIYSYSSLLASPKILEQEMPSQEHRSSLKLASSASSLKMSSLAASNSFTLLPHIAFDLRLRQAALIMQLIKKAPIQMLGRGASETN